MSVSSVALAQTKGDWVLGNYKGAGYWYPGVISSIQGSKITIQYDDGDRETVSINETRPYDWSIGKKVECNFKGQGQWYSGTISSLAGEKIGIAYDDGDKETTKTGRCRSS
nr:tudor domain-containing protein [Rhizobium sp. SSA_523]